MMYVRQELEGRSVYAAYTPDIPVSKEPGHIRLAVGRWQIRR